MKKRVISLCMAAVMLLMVFGLTGCGSKGSNNGTLNYGSKDEIDNFDPFTSQTTQFMSTVNFNCYECLMHLNADMEYEMDLATSYEQKDDTTIVFNLREGVKFHNGEKFTADDVVYTINTIKDPSVGAWRASQYENVKSVVADGDYKVTITLNSPQPGFLDNIAYTAIASKSTTPAQLKSQPVGTGAFKFVSWTPNDNITFEKFADYWDEEKVHFDKFIYKVIPDINVGVTNLKSGAIQVYGDLTTEAAKTVEGTDGLQVFKSKYSNKVYEWEIGRHNNPALADPEVVKAMFLCLDRNAIIDGVFNGMVDKAQSAFPSSAKYYYAADECKYDVEEAKKVLANTAFKDGFSFTATVLNNSKEENDALVIWQNELKKIGIEMKIEAAEFSVWLDKYLARDYDMISNTYSMVGTDPATYCNVILGDLPKYQMADLTELNQLISEAATSNDDKVREEKYKAIQELMVQYRPATSYVESPSLSGATSSLKDLVINGMGHTFIKGAHID